MSGAVAAGCRGGEGDPGCPRGTAASGADARPKRSGGHLPGARQPQEAREVALAREPLTRGASVIPDDKSPCEGTKHRVASDSEPRHAGGL